MVRKNLWNSETTEDKSIPSVACIDTTANGDCKENVIENTIDKALPL